MKNLKPYQTYIVVIVYRDRMIKRGHIDIYIYTYIYIYIYRIKEILNDDAINNTTSYEITTSWWWWKLLVSISVTI